MTDHKPKADKLEAETTWFHFFRDMIESGDVAKMGPHAVTVYLVIKAHTNFSTGQAFPSIDTIIDKSGISDRQVKRELKTLEEFGYITKERQGRKNIYTLREKVQITDEHGRPQAVATWDYLPSTVRLAVADLQNVLVSGELAGAKVVHIDRLNVQINTGSGTAIQVNDAAAAAAVDLLAELPVDLREKVIAARAASLRHQQKGEK